MKYCRVCLRRPSIPSPVSLSPFSPSPILLSSIIPPCQIHPVRILSHPPSHSLPPYSLPVSLYLPPRHWLWQASYRARFQYYNGVGVIFCKQPALALALGVEGKEGWGRDSSEGRWGSLVSLSQSISVLSSIARIFYATSLVFWFFFFFPVHCGVCTHVVGIRE